MPFLYSSFFVALACAGFVLLLTPTGSLPSPRWRWWARVAAVAPAVTVLGFAVQPDPLAPDYLGNPLAVPALAPALLVAALAGMAVTAAGLLVGAGSLVLRFRRARGIERLQLRWLALAGACASALLPVALVAGALALDPVVLGSLALCLALLPLATGAAILRYRLYDLDRIISRTLAYGLLTLLLGLAYAGRGPGAGPAPARGLQPGRGRRHPGRGRDLPAGSAAGSRSWSTGASTGAATTPPGPSQAFAPASATRSTWTP